MMNLISFKNNCFFINSSKINISKVYQEILKYIKTLSFDETKFIHELATLDKTKKSSYKKLKRKFFKFLHAEHIRTNDIDIFGCIYKLEHGFGEATDFLVGLVDFFNRNFCNIILDETQNINIAEFKDFMIEEIPEFEYMYTLNDFESDFNKMIFRGYITKNGNTFSFTKKFIESYKMSFFYEFDDSVQYKFGINLMIA